MLLNLLTFLTIIGAFSPNTVLTYFLFLFFLGTFLFNNRVLILTLLTLLLYYTVYLWRFRFTSPRLTFFKCLIWLFLIVLYKSLTVNSYNYPFVSMWVLLFIWIYWLFVFQPVISLHCINKKKQKQKSILII